VPKIKAISAELGPSLFISSSPLIQDENKGGNANEA